MQVKGALLQLEEAKTTKAIAAIGSVHKNKI